MSRSRLSNSSLQVGILSRTYIFRSTYPHPIIRDSPAPRRRNEVNSIELHTYRYNHSFLFLRTVGEQSAVFYERLKEYGVRKTDGTKFCPSMSRASATLTDVQVGRDFRFFFNFLIIYLKKRFDSPRLLRFFQSKEENIFTPQDVPLKLQTKRRDISFDLISRGKATDFYKSIAILNNIVAGIFCFRTRRIKTANLPIRIEQFHLREKVGY